jgi:hypothetical protein
VFLRALAVLAAIVVPLLLADEAIAELHPAMFWLGPLLAVACALPIVFKARPGAHVQAVVGVALAAMAAAASPGLAQLLRITGDPESMPVHDLREAPLPASAEGYVALRGYLIDDWVVDEYHPGDERRPDQNEAPDAVLLPLLGTEAERLDARALGRVVVARVNPRILGGAPVVTLRGRLGPVNAEIVDSLFIVQVEDSGPRPEAVMLDTLDMPTRGQALTRAALVVGSALLSLVLLVLAVPRATPASRSRSDDSA